MVFGRSDQWVTPLFAVPMSGPGVARRGAGVPRDRNGTGRLRQRQPQTAPAADSASRRQRQPGGTAWRHCLARAVAADASRPRQMLGRYAHRPSRPSNPPIHLSTKEGAVVITYKTRDVPVRQLIGASQSSQLPPTAPAQLADSGQHVAARPPVAAGGAIPSAREVGA